MNDSLITALRAEHKMNLDSVCNSMQHQIDSLAEIASASPSMELITQVHTFYNDSWTNLLWVIGTAFGFIGVIIPVGIQYFQRKDMSDRVEMAENRFQTILNETRNELEQWTIEHVATTFNDESQRITNQLENVQSESLALALFLQAKNSFNNGHTGEAILDMASATNRFIRCKDSVNILRALDNIIDWITDISEEEWKVVWTKNTTANFIDLQDVINDIRQNPQLDILMGQIVTLQKLIDGHREKFDGDSVAEKPQKK